ncbi:MAG: wax ester/triacylglycerol synthase family O-acyltransferase [Rubrivivax sp.]|nr:wax ester/triacylglycerol synthase family O-acyltransferase [Rubrivivax sp.]
MRQLSAHDASFLYADTRHANANVTLIHIYDQRTAPGGVVRFKSILQHIESRIAQLPLFRQKLHRVPLDLDHPYWVDDEAFDLEYHVRHIALPKPGDWRQFCIQASRIHARPLDLSRPLWEIHVIEGLDGLLDLPEGTFALLTKTHHAAIDVESGSEITSLLHDLTATPPVPAPPPPWFPEAPPGLARVLARGVAHTVAAPVTAAGPVGRAWQAAAPAAVEFFGDLWKPRHALPVTRFNAIVSPHRVFETRRFMLDELKAIRALAPEATVNDAVLAVCGGALRRYLQGHGELPRESLSAMAPFYVRRPGVAGGPGKAGGAGTGGKIGMGGRSLQRTTAGSDEPPQQLSWTRVDLGTHLVDARQRLAHIQAQTSSSEVIHRAVGARELVEAGHHLPAATLALAGKWLGAWSGPGGLAGISGLGSLERRAPPAHCTITNVPGPQETLYLCGARMTYFSAIMPISDGNGLVFAVTSYDGRLIISPTSCRELMPDPAVFARCVRDSFQELLALAREPVAAAGPASRKPRRKPQPHPQPSSQPAAAPKEPAPRRRATPARRRASPAGRRSPTSPAG